MFDARIFFAVLLSATSCAAHAAVAPPPERIAKEPATCPATPSSDVLQVFSKGVRRPGLVPAQIDAFLCPRKQQVARVCWDGRMNGWDGGHVEYPFAVDPSGVVAPPSSELEGAAAEIWSTEVHQNSYELAECVEHVVESWQFPRATFPTWVVIQFDFDRRKVAARPALAPRTE